MKFGVTGLDQLGQLADYWDIWFSTRMLELTGEAIVEDTRLRLEDDTTSPDGDPWDPWSDNPTGRGYASTRGPGDKLLFQGSTSGALSKSIEAQRRGNMLEVGSPLPYAQVHQDGSRDGNTPARPYVGISGELEVGLGSILEADFDGGWRAVRA